MLKRNVIGVLIAPLWNWNFFGVERHEVPHRSNRTFMELKYVIAQSALFAAQF